MSDGITLYCPRCGELKALKKEYDELKVKVRSRKLDSEEFIWYETSLPIYTCPCGARCVIEFMAIKKYTKEKENGNGN